MKVILWVLFLIQMPTTLASKFLSSEKLYNRLCGSILTPVTNRPRFPSTVSLAFTFLLCSDAVTHLVIWEPDSSPPQPGRAEQTPVSQKYHWLAYFFKGSLNTVKPLGGGARGDTSGKYSPSAMLADAEMGKRSSGQVLPTFFFSFLATVPRKL